MALVLTEEQQMLAEAARHFIAERSPVSAHRRLRDERVAKGYDVSLWREMGELGWPGIAIPEQYGGLGFGYVGAGIIAKEMGRTLCAAPFLSSCVNAATALVRGGSQSQKEALLPGIAGGEITATLVLDAGPRHEPEKSAVEATPVAGGYELNGSSRSVIDAAAAAWFLVAARRRDGDVSLYMVERGSRGVEIIADNLVDHRNYASVRFDKVAVSESAVLGGGAETIAAALDAGRICLAAEQLGGAEEAFARTLDYLKTREQFNLPIGSFQALQHRAAVMFGDLELCQSVVIAALQSLDANTDDVPALASLAKARANAVFALVSAEAIQMHGGIGMTDEVEIGFYFKRAAVARQLLGDDNYHANRYARLRGY